ncbi:TPA: hypothetical protein ACKCHH_001326 [Streptococcus pneumoniae]
MKIKDQTRKLAAGCSKHCFEVVDGTDVVSILHIRQGDIEEIFEEYNLSRIAIAPFLSPKTE